MKSLYKQLKAAGLKMGNHESDLHVEATAESLRIIARCEFDTTTKKFTNQLDGRTWYEVPFAYEPWWEGRDIC